MLGRSTRYLVFIAYVIIKMIQNFTSIDAHGRSQLTSLRLLQSNKILSIGHDSCVKLWDCRNLQLERSNKFKHAYLTALATLPKQILIGNGEGELMFLDADTLALKKVIKLHSDCINDIKIIDQKIVTASSDGSMTIIDPAATCEENVVVKVGAPLRQVERFRSNYYLAGARSFQLNSELQAQKSSDVYRYLPALGELYGSNDEKGFFGISKKFNTYVPCENMIQFNGGILGVSWSALSCFFPSPNDESISYSSARLSDVSKGDSILSLATIGKRVFAGSQCGKIYTFTVDPGYHWYDQL